MPSADMMIHPLRDSNPGWLRQSGTEASGGGTHFSMFSRPWFWRSSTRGDGRILGQGSSITHTILAALSVLDDGGVWLTYRNVYREMTLRG